LEGSRSGRPARRPDGLGCPARPGSARRRAGSPPDTDPLVRTDRRNQPQRERRSLMPVLMVRSKIKPENTPDIEAAINRVFSAIEQAQPAGVRYASSRLADGISFVVLLEHKD